MFLIDFVLELWKSRNCFCLHYKASHTRSRGIILNLFVLIHFLRLRVFHFRFQQSFKRIFSFEWLKKDGSSRQKIYTETGNGIKTASTIGMQVGTRLTYTESTRNKKSDTATNTENCIDTIQVIINSPSPPNIRRPRKSISYLTESIFDELLTTTTVSVSCIS